MFLSRLFARFGREPTKIIFIKFLLLFSHESYYYKIILNLYLIFFKADIMRLIENEQISRFRSVLSTAINAA
jgi:hypothetical protein